ncbi:unnamed protein product [Ixodes hexagonus]
MFSQVEHPQPNVWFQLYGASSHWSILPRGAQHETFLERLGRGGPITWPPRSPDITPLDLCVCVRQSLHHSSAEPLRPPCVRILGAVRTVTPYTLEQTWMEIGSRLDILRVTRGAHVGVH